MRTADLDIIMVPGWGNSGPDHWQSRWQAKLSTARRIDGVDWERPALDPWLSAIDRAVASAARPVFLIGHSLGSLAIAHAAPALDPARIAGAFLVSPPDLEASELELPEGVDFPGFRPLPLAPHPFPTALVASRADPYCHHERARHFAQSWGAKFIDGGEAGHINDASGHGPWPEGLLSFAGFLKSLTPASAAAN